MPGHAAGNSTKRYVWIKFKGRYVSGHHIAWLLHYKTAAPGQIDHINGITTDNRIENLRIATIAQNCGNRRTRLDNLSGLKGVQQRGPNKWRARIFADGRSIHLGFFESAEEAHAAYKAEAVKRFGEFARAG